MRTIMSHIFKQVKLLFDLCNMTNAMRTIMSHIFKQVKLLLGLCNMTNISLN